MPYSYDFQVGLGGIASNLSAPLSIGAEVVDPLWYLPRGIYQGGISNNYTGQYGVWATPIAFSRDMDVSEVAFTYFDGADAAAFTGAGADLIAFRSAFYAADANGIPHTFVKDMSYTTYTPEVDPANGRLGISSFPGGPVTLEAGKLYYLVQTAMACTKVAETADTPDSVLETDSTLLRYNVGAVNSLDPLASFGLTDEEVMFQPLGITGYFLDDVRAAFAGEGNALAAWPTTLGALWTSIFTSSNQIVVNVKGTPA